MLMSCHQWIDETTSMKSASIKLMHVHQLMMVPQWRHVSLYINNLSEKKAHLIWTSLQYNLHIPTTTPAAILLHNNSLMTYHQLLDMGVIDDLPSIAGYGGHINSIKRGSNTRPVLQYGLSLHLAGRHFGAIFPGLQFSSCHLGPSFFSGLHFVWGEPKHISARLLVPH